jgi:hypothetical protein
MNAGNSREDKTLIMRRNPALAKSNCEAFLIKLFLKVCVIDAQIKYELSESKLTRKTLRWSPK